LITTARFARLLALVVWIGGLIFFAFVMAPIAFHVLPTPHLAGPVVGAALRTLHRMGMVCALVIIVITLALEWTRRTFPICLIALAMLALTAWSQYGIIPRMEAVRAALGEVDSAPRDNPARLRFERLHRRSEHAEGVVLLGGLALTMLIARSDEQYSHMSY